MSFTLNGGSTQAGPARRVARRAADEKGKSLIKHALHRAFARPVLHPWFRLRRGLTLGVRAAVIGSEGVLLVRHTYSPGWILPGGGVERGETVYEALARELREESGIAIMGEPLLHGIFSNERKFPGDHVACFIVRSFSRSPWSPNGEIAAAEYFAPDALPSELTDGTRRRLAEIFRGVAIAAYW